MLGIPDGGGLSLGALPLAAAPLAAAITECLTTGQAIVRRALEMPHAGTVTHVGVTVSPLGPAERPGDGGVICLFSDLTSVIDLEEQLRLKETLARLGELTAGIAHEFRNGLATIHGYGKLLDPAALPAQFRPYVEGIRQETEALGQVVTNFLNFARPTQLSLATHDLGLIIERACDDLRVDARQLGGDIAVHGTFGHVEADDVLLRQAFMNLLRNAVEACQGAGVTPDVRVEGATDSAAAVVRVTVQDNGPGVPAESREKIFRPFFTTKNNGTGLGLAIVQKIIVTHNGRVAVTPGGGGACFQVTLPIS
jgi:signal transduction histidine kinase